MVKTTGESDQGQALVHSQLPRAGCRAGQFLPKPLVLLQHPVDAHRRGAWWATSPLAGCDLHNTD